MPITPIGTLRFIISRPFGRRSMETNSPTGSFKPATWRSPSAIADTRAFVRESLSIIISFTPFSRAAKTSMAFSASISLQFCSSRSAAASRTSFFLVSLSSAHTRDALFAHFPISVISLIISSPYPDYLLR